MGGQAREGLSRGTLAISELILTGPHSTWKPGGGGEAGGMGIGLRAESLLTEWIVISACLSLGYFAASFKYSHIY